MLLTSTRTPPAPWRAQRRLRRRGLPELPPGARKRRQSQIFPAADVEALAEVVHADVVNHELPPGLPQGLQGMQQMMLWLNRAFADLHYDIHQVIAEGDTAVVYCTMRGRHIGEFMGVPPTQRSVASDQVHIVRFQHGKGIEHWAVRDDLTLMRQLGVLPAERDAPAGAATA